MKREPPYFRTRRITISTSAILLVFLGCQPLLGQQVATLARMVTPPSWRGTNVVWNRDVQPHNKIDDTIDNSTNQVLDVVVNFRSCPTASDISALSGFSTNQLQLKYLSSIALRSVAKSDVTEIAAMTNVAFIEQAFGFSSLLTVSVPSMCVNAGSVSCPGNARALGYDGTGVNIAIFDTGVDINHAAFAATPLIGAYNAITKTFGFNNQADDIGHGTHVASIALGQATVNEAEGVAPKAGLIVVKVLDATHASCNTPGLWNIVTDGLQTLYDQQQSGAWQVNVVNMSLAQCDANGPVISDGTDAFSQLVNLAESMGMVVVAAAGNSGPNNVGLATPAAATRSITVAASQTQDTTTRTDDTIACFSSRGPRTATSIPLDDNKPEVAAPGAHLFNCTTFTSTGILAAKANSGTPDNGTTPMSGTSMASPHVAGLAALIIQAKPGINPASVKQLIIDTATAPDGTKQAAWQADSGYGYANAYAAVSAVASTDLTFPSYPPPISWESPDISIAPDPAIVGRPNTATVMIQNRGPNDAHNVRIYFGIYVYSASPPTFQNIGTVNVPLIQNGQTVPVSINWVPQAPGGIFHNCLQVEIGYGADTDFSNNHAARNITEQQSPVQFMVQNTATEAASTINLIPTWGPNTGGSSNNWTFTLQPTNVVLAANDCPVPITAELFPTGNAQLGEKQALRLQAVVNTIFGPISLGGVTVTATQTNLPNTNTFLPVYRVLQYGPAPSQAQTLASYLNINNNNLITTNGDVEFIDPTNWLAVPTGPVTNSTAISNLLATTENPYPSIPIRFEQLDFNALSNLTLFSTNAALASAGSAFAYANLTPQLGTPVVGYTSLNAFWTNDSNVMVSNSAYLDTELNYQFTDAAGYPLLGPGAQVQVAYGPTGNVTRLHYSAPQLATGKSVQIIPATVASSRAAPILDPGGTLQPNLVPRLVYYVPHWPWTNPCLTCPPPNYTNTVLPWYQVGGTATVTNPFTGQSSALNLTPVLIPATDDTNFVPSISLSASSLGTTQVVASVAVGGGMPPYTYQWAASSTALSDSTGTSVSYTPVFRAAPPTLNITHSNNVAVLSWADPSAAFILQSSPNLVPGAWAPVSGQGQTNNGIRTMTVSLLSPQTSFFRLFLSATQTVSQAETITVIVTDANGVYVQASQNLNVQATPRQSATVGPTPKVIGVIDWGTESPYDPGLGTQDRNDWRSGMRQPGGGAERLTWTGNLSWKLDFVEEPHDIDQSEVDNADIVFYVGHGNPQVFTFTAGPGPDPTRLEYNSAPRAWGDYDQEWMCLLSCEVLQFNDNGNLVWDRWGPDFDGLHILTGFRTLAGAQTGFPAVYADNLLGWRHFLFFRVPWPPMSVVNSWFNAAAADGTGRAAALGPIGPGGCCDINDYYWGQGPVGPTIRAGSIRGWWYISQP